LIPVRKILLNCPLLSSRQKISPPLSKLTHSLLGKGEKVSDRESPPEYFTERPDKNSPAQDILLVKIVRFLSEKFRKGREGVQEVSADTPELTLHSSVKSSRGF
jgi:hypothetical protein